MSDLEIKHKACRRSQLTYWHYGSCRTLIICTNTSNVVLTGPLPHANDSFVVADSYLGNIYQVDTATGATGQLLPFGTASYPIALAYDSTAKLVYWTDAAAHTINRYSLLTNSSTVIYRDPSYTGNDIHFKLSLCHCQAEH